MEPDELEMMDGGADDDEEMDGVVMVVDKLEGALGEWGLWVFVDIVSWGVICDSGYFLVFLRLGWID